MTICTDYRDIHEKQGKRADWLDGWTVRSEIRSGVAFALGLSLGLAIALIGTLS